eukprot:CAMPEP_0175959912 /NCGR_PEP_ID=MMETSP0108-20121206/35069_1 /TAXON_ID=195067 ORGANISM="Goniomonas pacifica, Strain CCMP1869" /NCGR_SAMPLE_ID=MMETSP0108 /ASSEMBLY_ACC=CAM_ASM_000204 /LENGTH=86 /DNA_ID=CAMNT_0017287435 /DNA_START=51 /DNA_END=311 /DNA_ORIENTATION=+
MSSKCLQELTLGERVVVFGHARSRGHALRRLQAALVVEEYNATRTGRWDGLLPLSLFRCCPRALLSELQLPLGGAVVGDGLTPKST